jgi:transcriptional regulator with XRE-family HTH domain
MGRAKKMSKPIEYFIKGRAPLPQPYAYRAIGLDNVLLLNGVSSTQTAYGPMIHIECIHGLHRAIGLGIAEKPEAMSGAEFRFLRKQLGLTQEELAARMRVSDQTIANYEKGKSSLGPAEPFMRALYLVHILPNRTRVEVLKPMMEKTAREMLKKLPAGPRSQVVEGWQQGRDEAA